MLSKEEFKNLTKIKKTDYGYFYKTKTKICEYGQVYEKGNKENLMERYLKFYYPLYASDEKNLL